MIWGGKEGQKTGRGRVIFSFCSITVIDLTALACFVGSVDYPDGTKLRAKMKNLRGQTGMSSWP